MKKKKDGLRMATLEFLGMRKLIEVPVSAMNYKVLLPTNIDGVDRYIVLVFTAENNPLYGMPHETELCFTFDHVEEERMQ